jgi:hypothetical protein
LGQSGHEDVDKAKLPHLYASLDFAFRVTGRPEQIPAPENDSRRRSDVCESVTQNPVLREVEFRIHCPKTREAHMQTSSGFHFASTPNLALGVENIDPLVFPSGNSTAHGINYNPLVLVFEVHVAPP